MSVILIHNITKQDSQYHRHTSVLEQFFESWIYELLTIELQKIGLLRTDLLDNWSFDNWYFVDQRTLWHLNFWDIWSFVHWNCLTPDLFYIWTFKKWSSGQLNFLKTTELFWRLIFSSSGQTGLFENWYFGQLNSMLVPKFN